MNPIDNKLTDSQKTAIRVAFTTHNIKIPEKRFQQLLSHVEQNMTWWEDYQLRERRGSIGQTEMTAEIKHLRKTLKKINPSTREALARFYTITRPQKPNTKRHASVIILLKFIRTIIFRQSAPLKFLLRHVTKP